MNLQEARTLIRTGNSRERLDAARVLAREATAIDRELVAEALRSESVSWVRSSLEEAEMRLAMSQSEPLISPLDVDGMAVDDVYAEAIKDTTGRLLHEIVPIAGALRMFAEMEMKGFDSSEVKRQLGRLDDMLDAIGRLSRAAAAPKLEEFNLAEALAFLVRDFAFGGVEVQLSGPDPLDIVSDRTLVGLVVKVGLTNAAEASLQRSEEDPPPISLKWDGTDLDQWVSILDRGLGLPPTAAAVFEMGVSGKKGHLGMGLALAVRAAQSLSGRVHLTPRDGGGVQYLFRWPKIVALV